MGWLKLRALPVVLMACACAEEPTFDERYDTARETIQARAHEIDQELDAAEINPSRVEAEDPVAPS